MQGVNCSDRVCEPLRAVAGTAEHAGGTCCLEAVEEALGRFGPPRSPALAGRVRQCTAEVGAFLTLRAPYRKLSTGGLYDVVARHYPANEALPKGRGPHGLRHACARHLVESGQSFKETGDHLGHRSPASTRVYAKVDLAALRLVALDDLGGLA